VEWSNRLNEIGYERARRAVAALTLSLFIFFFLAIALLLAVNEQPAWVPPFLALSVAYGVAFMGVAAEWFWGRWFAAGLGWSGLMLAIAPMVMTGSFSPFLAVYGGLHGLVILMLGGPKMAARYDQQQAWRERYGMDEFGVDRLRKTVTRASASLPSVILWALAPKEPGQGMLVYGVCAAAALLAVTGLGAVVRLRTWGVFALAAAATLFMGPGLAGFPHVVHAGGPALLHATRWLVGPTSRAALLLLALMPVTLSFLVIAPLPFVGPVWRFVRSRR